ncbi:MAG: fumarylacetoacetate hydrolase family protein [Gemmatimonadaceae bacterium]|nr:fumarylacetoacetate hydrolase family protein [Gemmatimonadaceae bacterium]
MPLVPRPSKIVCIGRNYAEHARELGNAVPDSEPLFFLKPPSSLIGTGDAIVLPPQSSQVEHEGEIAVLIGSTLRHASEAEARRAVRAIVALNDITARDLQRKDSQWTRAKGFDTFCAVGEPFFGEVDLANIEVITRVNGAERQRGNSSQMVFSIPFCLSFISHIMTLEPGDLVATGTPAGVGRLSSGDQVEVELVGISTVRNPVV